MKPEKNPQVPLLMKNMMRRRQHLMYMSNIRYGLSRNQLISWCVQISDIIGLFSSIVLPSFRDLIYSFSFIILTSLSSLIVPSNLTVLPSSRNYIGPLKLIVRFLHNLDQFSAFGIIFGFRLDRFSNFDIFSGIGHILKFRLVFNLE